MSTRFEKTLEQIARAESELEAERVALESRAQKVRRLEELIRAKEAMGDRIVISIGAALAASAMALPVYAAFSNDGYVYLSSISSGASTRSNFSGNFTWKWSESTARVMTKALGTEISAASLPEIKEEAVSHRSGSDEIPPARYVIHRATETSALIEGPNGLWWVTPGMKIPGAGQILSIERSNAGWAVVTSETIITQDSTASPPN